jgi:repressor LexA
MRQELTDRQRAVLDHVVAFQERHGRSPTGPEIARHFGYADASTAYQHLEAIERKGYVRIVRQSARSAPIGLTLTPAGRRLMHAAWPRFGRIPAGPLDVALGEEEEVIEGVEDLFPMIRAGDYFLSVEGDSMIGVGLEEGMTLLMRPVERMEQVRQGDICAVWVEGSGGTLKRVFREGATVRLVPENEAYEEVSHPADQVRVQGRLMAAVRAF